MNRWEVRRRRKILKQRQRAGEASEYLMVDREGNVILKPPNAMGSARDFFGHPKIRSDLKKLERLAKHEKGVD